jgi:hypothetical protein
MEKPCLRFFSHNDTLSETKTLYLPKSPFVKDHSEDRELWNVDETALALIHSWIEDMDNRLATKDFDETAFVAEIARRNKLNLVSVGSVEIPSGYDKMQTLLLACLDRKDWVEFIEKVQRLVDFFNIPLLRIHLCFAIGQRLAAQYSMSELTVLGDRFSGRGRDGDELGALPRPLAVARTFQ